MSSKIDGNKERPVVNFAARVRDSICGKMCLLHRGLCCNSVPKYSGAFLFALILVACQLTPTKPDALFVHYRDLMKSDNISEARLLLSDDSRELALKLAAEHGLRQPPENLALLNVLDPVAAPAIGNSDDLSVILNIRTLKGGSRTIQVVRKETDPMWKIDMVNDLRALQTFLQARGALDMIREQAGEYAASLKEFNNQLEKMDIIGPVPAASSSAPKALPQKKVLKKPAPKPPVKPKKQSD